jgi:hypothetical protein
MNTWYIYSTIGKHIIDHYKNIAYVFNILLHVRQLFVILHFSKFMQIVYPGSQFYCLGGKLKLKTSYKRDAFISNGRDKIYHSVKRRFVYGVVILSYCRQRLLYNVFHWVVILSYCRQRLQYNVFHGVVILSYWRQRIHCITNVVYSMIESRPH